MIVEVMQLPCRSILHVPLHVPIATLARAVRPLSDSVCPQFVSRCEFSPTWLPDKDIPPVENNAQEQHKSKPGTVTVRAHKQCPRSSRSNHPRSASDATTLPASQLSSHAAQASEQMDADIFDPVRISPRMSWPMCPEQRLILTAPPTLPLGSFRNPHRLLTAA